MLGNSGPTLQVAYAFRGGTKYEPSAAHSQDIGDKPSRSWTSASYRNWWLLIPESRSINTIHCHHGRCHASLVSGTRSALGSNSADRSRTIGEEALCRVDRDWIATVTDRASPFWYCHVPQICSNLMGAINCPHASISVGVVIRTCMNFLVSHCSQ